MLESWRDYSIMRYSCVTSTAMFPGEKYYELCAGCDAQDLGQAVF